jgi:hypothetical protein
MAVTTVLALLGMLVLIRRAATWALVAWFSLFFGVFLPYFVGSFRLPGLERYALHCTAPYALLAGYGLDAVSQWATGKARGALGSALPRALAAGFLLAGALAAPRHMRRWDAPTRALAAEHRFLQVAMAQLPPDAMVLFAIPSVIVNMERSSAWPYPGVDANLWEELARNSRGGTYLYSGVLPWKGNPESALVRQWYDGCDGRPVFTTSVDGHRLAVYRLCEPPVDWEASGSPDP